MFGIKTKKELRYEIRRRCADAENLKAQIHELMIELNEKEIIILRAEEKLKQQHIDMIKKDNILGVAKQKITILEGKNKELMQKLESYKRMEEEK